MDSLALAWQVGKEFEIPPDPEKDERIAQIQETIEQVLAEGKEPTPENLGLSQVEVMQYQKDMDESGVSIA